MATFCYGMIDEVCVMLVDNDKEFVIAITNLLKSHNYTGDISINLLNSCVIFFIRDLIEMMIVISFVF